MSVRLLDIFPDLLSRWSDRISGEGATALIENADPAALEGWLNELNQNLLLENIRFGASRSGAALEADLTLQNSIEGFEIFHAAIPKVAFRLRTTSPAAVARLYVNHSRGSLDGGEPPGPRVVIEGLPVEIRLPPSLVQPPQPSGGAPPVDITVGTFTPGILDSLQIDYRDEDSTSIHVHVRVLIDEDLDLVIQPAVPISLGRCRFFGLACRAVHDFMLIPAPRKARDYVDWLRHDLDGLTIDGYQEGYVAARSVHFDAEGEPFKTMLGWLDRNGERDPQAELVLDDLAFPFALPVPRHFTVGLRRGEVDPDKLHEQYDFASAPARFNFSDSIGLILNFLHFETPSDHPDDPKGLPFGFEAVLHFGGEESSRNAFGITLEEQTTVLATYLRSIDETGPDVPAFDWKIYGVHVRLAALRAGFSVQRLIDDKGFWDSLVVAGDLLIEDATAADSFFKIQGLNGEPVRFVLERVGYWFGGSLKGLALPSGVQLVFGDAFHLRISELGIIADISGGQYVYFSGGVHVPADFELTFRRLRFRIGGNPQAPAFGLDGFFLRVVVPERLTLEAGGSYQRRALPETGERLTELSLTGGGSLAIGPRRYKFHFDFLYGDIDRDPDSAVAGARDFSYLLFHAVVGGKIPFFFGTELNSVRFLAAWDMRPALLPSDLESRELRYYEWYRRGAPLEVTNDRALGPFEAADGEHAVGLGFGVFFPAVGELADLRLLAMYLIADADRPDTVFVSGELRVFEKPDPLAWVVVEWTFGERFGIYVGIDVGPEDFLTDPPEWLQKLIRLRGTLYVGGPPTTIALGRLDDPLTWASFKFETTVVGKTAYVEIAGCLELTEGDVGADGVAFALRAGVTGRFCKIFEIEAYFGFGFLYGLFYTGSVTNASNVWLEGGLRIRIWGFFRFACTARAELREVGPHPAYLQVSVKVRIETPWYLPDVTFRFNWEQGRIQVVAQPLATAPARRAAALVEATGQTATLHLAPAGFLGTGPDRPPVMSMEEVRAVEVPSRDARHAAFAASSPQPIGTDSTVQIAFSVPVTDAIGFAAPPTADLGTQASGDLQLRYELTAVAVHRRARFDPGAAWRPLFESEALQAVDDGAGGFVLDGSFEPLPITAFWESVVVRGEPAATTLLLNATTPFSFTTWDPEADEAIVEANPSWPCCDGKRGRRRVERVLVFDPYPLGDPLPSPVPFPGARSRFQPVRPGDVVPAAFAGRGLSDDARALRLGAEPGLLFRCVLTELAAWIDVHLSWPRQASAGVVRLVSFDDAGELATIDVPLGPERMPTPIRLKGARAARGALAAVVPGPVLAAARAAQPGRTPRIEVNRVSYVTFESVLAELRWRALCGRVHEQGLSGEGKIGFLPNHDYEVELRTRAIASHPSDTSEDAEYRQYVYFRTKGLPGLNAVPRVGAEVEPHVEAEYPRRGSVLYRGEPVAIAFGEQFNLVVPVSKRPPRPASEERDLLMKLSLVVRPEVPLERDTLRTATSPDWIVAHRTGPVVIGPRRTWSTVAAASVLHARTAPSQDERRARLGRLLGRPGSNCQLPDPLLAPSGVLIGEPIGGGTAASGDPLWPEGRRHVATVAIEGAPFVHREGFHPADLGALTRVVEGGGAVAWDVVAGQLIQSGAGRGYAIFGDELWNHYQVEVALRPEGEAAGVAVAVSAGFGPPARALCLLVESDVGGRHLVARRRMVAGQPLEEIARAALPEPSSDDPLPLRVTAFDDRVRVEIGEVRLEVDRGELREGRVALVAAGPARFANLRVSSIELYELPFTTSRYESFADHIGSWSGRLATTSPEEMGAGAVSATVGGLLTAHAADIARVMTPEADAGERQHLFDRFTSELGLAARDDVRAVELTRYLAAGATGTLLIESPEPLRFGSEVTVSIARVDGGVVGPVRPDLLSDVRLARLLGDTVELELPPGGVRGPLSAVHVLDGPDGRRLRVFRATVERRGVRRLRAALAAEVRLPGEWTPPLAHELEKVPAGRIALIAEDLRVIVDVLYPFDPPPVPPLLLTVLSDGPALRSLLIPTSGGAAVPLEPGRYRLTFTIDRLRWPQQPPADPRSRLTDSAALDLVWS